MRWVFEVHVVAFVSRDEKKKRTENVSGPAAGALPFLPFTRMRRTTNTRTGDRKIA